MATAPSMNPAHPVASRSAASPALLAPVLAVVLAACGATDGATSLDEALAVADAGAQAGDVQLKDGGDGGGTSITLSSASAVAGQAVTVTVSLGFSGSGGVPVSILFPAAVLAGPKVVTIPKGQQSASVTLIANPYLAAATTVSVMARTSTPFPATLSIASLTITPGPQAGSAAPRVTSVQLGAASVTSGTPVSAVVTLSGAAPAGGLAVQVALSNDQFMRNGDVPPVVVVPAGASSAAFTVRTHLVTAGVTTWADFVVANVYGGPFAGAALTVTQ